jgi:hypothetical protein
VVFWTGRTGKERKNSKALATVDPEHAPATEIAIFEAAVRVR